MFGRGKFKMVKPGATTESVTGYQERGLADDQSLQQPTQRNHRSTTHKWVGWLTLAGVGIVVLIVMISAGGPAWLFLPVIALTAVFLLFAGGGFWFAWRANRRVERPLKGEAPHH